MTCSDVQQLLPELLDGAPDATFQTAFDSHVQICPDCAGLVSDLKLITSQARDLTEMDEPPARVWVNIAAQLRAEGLIREPEALPGRPVLVSSSPRRRWSAWWLAPVAAALLAAGSYVISHKSDQQIAKQVPVPQTVSPSNAPQPVPSSPTQSAKTDTPTQSSTPVVASSRVAETAPQEVATKSDESGPASPRVLSAPSSKEDQQFLKVVSTLAPSSRATYENQLEIVNADIQETQAYVDQNPGDADARQHLMDAYQQKALLYQIAMDRIQ
jgi:hypothetical protein